jgi:hypothetical protein
MIIQSILILVVLSTVFYVRNMELKTGSSKCGFGAERFIASLLALTSFESYNTGYMAHFVLPNPAFSGTSYSPKTLGEIMLR